MCVGLMQAYAANMKKLFPDFNISSFVFGYSVKQIKRPVKVYKDSIFYIFLTRTWVVMS